MKIDLVLSRSDDVYIAGNHMYYMLYVTGCHIRPISNLVRFNSISDERIIDQPHQYNIKQFYRQTRDMFYECTIDPSLKSDWPIIIPKSISDEQRKYLKNWDDTYWAGTQRMSYQLYGTTHECLIPLWLEDCAGLKFIINIGKYNDKSGQDQVIRSCIIDLTPNQTYKQNCPQFHKDFVKYINNFLEYIETSKPNNDVIKINFKTNTAYIRGLNVNNGTVQTITDYNMVNNIMYRERPLLEFNSILTNAFRDNQLITTQLLNFNLCFDTSDLLSASYQLDMLNRPNMFISVNTQCLDTGGVLCDMEMADIYTNHEYVPRPAASSNDVYSLSEAASDRIFQADNGMECGQGPNALDYKHDNLVTTMMHQNKIIQPICHWVFTDSPSTLFNVYDGFGSWELDNNGNPTWNRHVYAFQNDPDLEGKNGENVNPSWARKLISSGSEVTDILASPEQYQGRYLQDMSSYINGLRFNYQKLDDRPSWPDRIYIALGTTPDDSDFPGNNTHLNSQDTIAIWSSRYTQTPAGNMIDTLPQNDFDITSDEDKAYDIAYGHDMDNRFTRFLINDRDGDGVTDSSYGTDKSWDYSKNVPLGRGYGGMNFDIFRKTDNNYGLYVCMSRQEINGENVLNVILWTRSCGSKPGIAGHTDSCLSLASVRRLLKKYVSYYGSIIKDKNGDWPADAEVPDMEALEAVIYALDSIRAINVVWFDNTISPYIDNTLDQDAGEMMLYKDTASQAYVFRYDDKIRPAIFPVAARRQRGTGLAYNQYPMEFAKGYGRNFLYLKDMCTMDDYLRNTEKYQPIPAQNINTSVGGTYWRINTVSSQYMNYVNTGVPPKYPSLDYESVHKILTSQCQDIYVRSEKDGAEEYWITQSEESARKNLQANIDNPDYKTRSIVRVNGNEYRSSDNQYGDLMYDEPIYNLYALETPGDGHLHPTGQSPYAEYKWFNWSRVVMMASSVQVLHISVTDNTDSVMQAAAIEAFKQDQNMIGDEFQAIDYTFLMQLYNIKYNFIDYTDDGTGTYTYNYDVYIALK